MRGITIITERKKNYEEYPPAALLCLIAGLLGILQFFDAFSGIKYSKTGICLLAVSLCAGLWYVRFYRRRFFGALIGMVLAGAVIAAFFWRERLRTQGMAFRTLIIGGDAPQTADLTEFMIVIVVLLVLELFILEILLHDHWILYLLTSALILMAPMMGISLGADAIVLLVVFQMTFWTMQMTKGSDLRELRKKSLLVVLLVTALSFTAAFSLRPHYEQSLYDFVFQIEEYVYQSIDRALGQDQNQIADGQINSGNLYQNGESKLEIILSDQPTEPLYLRSFAGGEYTGGGWQQANDEELLTDILQDIHVYGLRYRARSMFRNMYFELNENQPDAAAEPYRIRIHPLDEQDGNSYVPYYSRRELGGNVEEYRHMGWEGDTYQYFEQKDMDIDWSSDVPAYYGRFMNQYVILRDAYMEAIQSAYVSVPEEELPRLSALVEEHPFEDTAQITEFILETLHSRAVYTRTPGWTPFHVDIAEYFLFENGRGYCQHFALTATLMYRLYDIPARYAAGYMISPDDFEEQENGTYRAVASDENAHAWAEIFLEEYGWTPIEVTPAAEGEEEAAVDSVDSEADPTTTEATEEENETEVSTEETETEAATERIEESEQNVAVDNTEEQLSGIITGILFCSALALIPVVLYVRRQRYRKEMNTKGCRAFFSRFMEMLHFAGYCPEFDGSEENYAAACAAAIPVVSAEEISAMLEIVSEAAFGPEGVSAEKDRYVKELYEKTASYIKEQLPWDRKLVFIWWRRFQ